MGILAFSRSNTNTDVRKNKEKTKTLASTFMLLKSQTKAIQIIFSVIPNQPEYEVGNLTCSSNVVYITYLFFHL